MLRRLFLGFPVPASIRTSLTYYTESIAEPTLRFVNPENYHITVSFFGEQEEEKRALITDTIASAVKTFKPLTLRFNTIVFAPPKRTPSMIWAEYHSSGEFTELVNGVDSAVRQVITYADKREGQLPIPHITLARFRSPVTTILPQIKLDPIHAHTLALFESKRTETGHEYTMLSSFPLH